MTNEDRIHKLEKAVRNFNLVISGTNEIQGGFPELKKMNSVEERLKQLEEAHDKFTIRGGLNANVDGSLKTGFAINLKCPGGGQPTGGAVPSTPPTPPPPCVCPGDVTWNCSGTVTIECSSSLVCHGTGTIPWTGGEFSCTYQGGFNCPDCDNMPVSISLSWFDGPGWFIDIFIESGALCDPDSTWDTSAGDPIFLTDACTPVGDYSFDLVLTGGSGTCHVDLAITAP